MTRRFSSSVSMMFREFPLLERFARVRDAGFVGVEIQFLAEGVAKEMAAAARASGLETTLINVGMGDYLTGGPGLSGVPGREEEFQAALGQAYAAAQVLQPRFIHLGPSRVPDGVDRQLCFSVYRRNIAHAVSLKQSLGLTAALLIEPMNRTEAPTALINDVDEGAAFIRDGFMGQVALQFDVYHVAMNGHDVVSAFERHKDIISHVQFSDIPGRTPPGEGHLKFSEIFRGIESNGYEGIYGAEYMPNAPTLETLGWMSSLS